MTFLYLVVQQKMDSLLICPFFEAVTGDRGVRPTAEWHICSNNPRSLKWGIDIHFTTCNKLISCRKTGFLRKHSEFMTYVGQVQELGCHPIFRIHLYPKLRLRLQLLSLNRFQSMTITVFAAGFFALLGGVGGLKDCTMGDTDLFSDENEHLLF